MSRLFILFIGLVWWGMFALPTAYASQDFDKWAEKFAGDWVRTDPSLSTMHDYLPREEQRLLDRQLTPYTAEARNARVTLAQRGLAELRAFPRDRLQAHQRLAASVIQNELGSVVRSAQHMDLEYPFRSFLGIHLLLVDYLTRFHPLRDGTDVDNYLARLAQVGQRMDEATAWAKELEAKGHRMPDFITQSALGQFERFLAPAPKDNVFVSSLRNRLASLSTVSDTDKQRWLKQAEIYAEQQVMPAYLRAQALLKEQLPKTTSQAGWGARKGGTAAYQEALRQHTTTTMTAAEIHAIGLREVARIETQMDQILRKLGYKEGSVEARYQLLEKSLQPPSGADPRAGLLAKFQAMIDDAEIRSRAVFELRPKAACIVQREPLISEVSASARYTPPRLDGSLPGTFWVPLPGPQFRIAGMRTLTYHEAIPGHHFQYALAQELQTIPRYLRGALFGRNSAYGEGWALYAEQLAVELGWYEGDDIGLLGQLQAQLFRARRLVTDTGMHAMNWTRQQVIDYGIPPSEADRYAVWPGQATSYMVGMLHILELRQKAKDALGDKFDIKQFHNAILGSGRLPLDVLSELVDGWIVEQKLRR